MRTSVMMNRKKTASLQEEVANMAKPSPRFPGIQVPRYSGTQVSLLLTQVPDIAESGRTMSSALRSYGLSADLFA